MANSIAVGCRHCPQPVGVGVPPFILCLNAEWTQRSVSFAPPLSTPPATGGPTHKAIVHDPAQALQRLKVLGEVELHEAGGPE